MWARSQGRGSSRGQSDPHPRATLRLRSLRWIRGLPRSTPTLRAGPSPYGRPPAHAGGALHSGRPGDPNGASLASHRAAGPRPRSSLGRFSATKTSRAPPRRREPLPFGRLVLGTGQEFPLRYDDNLIGRASPGEGINPVVDLSAADTSGSVSRRHARIGKDDTSIYVEDLGSSNGSRHNGQPLRAGMQTPLQDGDELVFGSLQFRFHKI